MKVFRLVFVAIVCVAAWAAAGRADPITQIVSFGDSLSDVGNTYAQYGYPASPPYAQGRYSNGPIWLDRLAAKLGVAAPTASVHGGHAAGGAAIDTPGISPVPGYAPLLTPALKVVGLVPNVNTQIASYLGGLASHPVTPGTLYTLWAGANDFFDGPINPGKAADDLAADVQTLISKGAKNVLVANLPSLGQTPLGGAIGQTSPQAQAGLDAAAFGFDYELKTDLDRLQAAHPDVRIGRLDAYGLFQSVQANPSAFGLTDVTDPSLYVPGSNPNDFLFWDAVHPTAAGGDIIGDAAYKATTAPEPSAVVLLVVGCAGLIGCGRQLRRMGL